MVLRVQSINIIDISMIETSIDVGDKWQNFSIMGYFSTFILVFQDFMTKKEDLITLQ